MTYLIVQLQLFLLLAFILGILLGWWFRHFGARKLEESLRSEIAERNSRMGHIENERLELKLLAEERLLEGENARNEIVVLQQQLTENHKVSEECRAEIIALHDSLLAKEQRITQLEEEGRSQRDTEQDLRREGDELKAKLDALQGDLQHLEAEQQSLLDQLDVEQSRKFAQDNALDEAGERDATLAFQLQQRDRELRRLTALLESQTAKTASALAARDLLLGEAGSDAFEPQEADAALQVVEQQLIQCREECTALQKQLQACEQGNPTVTTSDELGISADAIAAAEAKMFSTAPTVVDELQRISGVGPKLEAMLNELGIYQFQQIASFNADDVRWVDYHLTAFKGRISRDDWVGQAAHLHAENADG